jgi:hypothetical protein
MVIRLIRLAAPFALILLVSACAQIPDPPILSRAVDPTSPAAQRVLRAAEEAQSASYPTFADLQPYPTDVRTPAEWNAAATGVMSDRDALAQWRRANPPELTDTEAFARSQRQAFGFDRDSLPPAPTPEESAAYARAQRERAAGPR